MNNTELYLSIGVPTVTVIFAWLSNRSDINRLNDKVDRLGETLRGEVSTLWVEMMSIRLDHHKDNLVLMGYMVPLHECMAKLESRTN